MGVVDCMPLIRGQSLRSDDFLVDFAKRTFTNPRETSQTNNSAACCSRLLRWTI